MLMDVGSQKTMLWDLVENHAEAGRLSIEQLVCSGAGHSWPS
jgi:hypothetical protein